jgi:hypothetical protein
VKRYRKGKVKREHGMIPGLQQILEELARAPEVTSIIPGRIRRTRHSSGTGCSLRVQSETGTGLKCVGRVGSAVQEVFVVTNSPAVVRSMIGPRKP